jgi:ubiquinol-cytochrome c reductase cytochrome b subunit
LLTGIFIFVHYYKVVLYGISLPPGREAIGEDTAKRVPRDERVYFLPDIATNEIMWGSLATLALVVGSYFFFSWPLESHANPLITPLHVVAPWYLSWSQGWLKLADKVFIAFIFIPALATAFFVMPYVEVGRSRRYADRRVGLSVMALFIAFMLVSNWMGSPEYLVQSSSEAEVAQVILPQEGHSELMAVPYTELLAVLGGRDAATVFPGQTISAAPHLTEVLHHYEKALATWSCTMTGNPDLEPCIVTPVDGGVRYDNSRKTDVMPDPVASLKIEQVQENLLALTVEIQVPDPQNPGSLRADFHYTKHRHADAAYEEE